MTESRDVAANQVPSSVVCAITHAPASGVLAPDDTEDIVGIDLHGGWSCRCASGRVTTHVNRNTERPVLPGFCGIGSSAVPLGAMSGLANYVRAPADLEGDRCRSVLL